MASLNELGIEILDVTPYVYGDRKSEIVEYLKIHKDIEQFLILDDDFIGDNLKEHQVLLDMYNGLCKEHVGPSVNILNGKLGFYPPDFDFQETLEERMFRISKYHSRKK